MKLYIYLKLLVLQICKPNIIVCLYKHEIVLHSMVYIVWYIIGYTFEFVIYILLFKRTCIS